jgi:hypothetical protein
MMEVYKAIAAVQSDLSKTGISKNRKNHQGSGYMFRGIDDVYAALSPLLAEHGLVIIPRMISREVSERQSAKGGALFYTVVHAEFDFVSAKDGSKHTASTFGEAMDSGDKSTNKAMSAAYKYVAFLTFAIPTEGDNDADAQTHEIKPMQAAKPALHPNMITESQLEELRALIETYNIDIKVLCDHYRVGALPHLTEVDANHAITGIKRKAAK